MNKVTIIILSFLLLFAGAQQAHAGFGVSPGLIDEPNLIPGSQFEYTIYLVQGTPDYDLPVNVHIDSGDGIEDWVTFKNGNEFIIPEGVQQYPLNVLVKIPEDTELGIYKAFIRVNTVPQAISGGGQVVIAIGGRVDLNITVGNDIVEEYEISLLKILDIKENQDPEVSVRVKNTGNVSTAPALATFELFNRFGTVRLGFAESDEFVKIPSFSEEEQVVSFPIDIRFAPGEYWAHVKIYDDGGAVIRELKTVFDVKEITLVEKILGYSWIGGLVVALVLVWFILRKVRKRRG